MKESLLEGRVLAFWSPLMESNSPHSVPVGCMPKIQDHVSFQEILVVRYCATLDAPSSIKSKKLRVCVQVWEEHLSLPISQENEESICVSMIEGIRASLSNYETSIEEDSQLLGALAG